MGTTLSTLGESNYLISQFTSLQGSIQNLQTEVSTGDNTQVYSGLGAQASLDISLRQQADTINDLQNTVSQLTVRTSLVDKSLLIVNDAALAVQNEAFQTPSFPTQRADLVNAAQSAINQISQQLQTTVDGRNLFGGTETQTNPITGLTTLLPQVQTAVTTALNAVPPPANVPAAIQAAVAGVFSTTAAYYNGGPPTPPTQIAPGLTVNTSITAADPSFQTLLTGLYTLAALPASAGQTATLPNIDDAQFDATASAAASQISQGLSQLQDVTESNGRNQALLSDESTQQAATLTTLQTQIDNIENVNVADAATRLTQLQAQLQASFHIVADLGSISLINLLPVPPAG
jgi:flagellar hook-associated protein 3 FlgL